jgi:multicomponent Na+:H+ antiporter subunit D
VSTLLPLAVGLPLLAAAVSAGLRSSRGAQRFISVAVTVGLVATGASLSAVTVGGRVVTERVGGWPAPFAITFAADPFAALMLTVAAGTVGICIWYAAASGEDHHPYFHPLALVSR